MLHFLDALLTGVHLFIICFNLFAWIPQKTRRMHLWSAGITLGCWIGLAPWFGLGYCPVTDWQWDVKEQLGERNLPNSFVKYSADKLTGLDISPTLVGAWTVGLFAAAILASVILNVRGWRRRRTKAAPEERERLSA